MKLLILTQKMDKDDPILGFFHGWIKNLATRTDRIIVVCLYKGVCDLPKNVTVYSLGKDERVSKFVYIYRFYTYIVSLRKEYDSVFVHMNQEYVILGGLLWKILGIHIFFWRNHPYGNMWTRLSVAISKKVFYTSSLSYTARYKKSVMMPVGIDTELFYPSSTAVVIKNSVCMVGRISPIKKVDLALLAMKKLIDSGQPVTLSIVGPCLAEDKIYAASLHSLVEQNNLNKCVTFFDAVSQQHLPDVYRSHRVILNLTEAGSFDKTIIEAAACGSIPLVANTSLGAFLPEACMTKPDPQSIADSIRTLFHTDHLDIKNQLQVSAAHHSLQKLIDKLVHELTL